MIFISEKRRLLLAGVFILFAVAMDTLTSLFQKYLNNDLDFDIKACYDEVVFRNSIGDIDTANKILTFTFNTYR